MIKGFRFTNQLANAEVDARIHQAFLNNNDGIFYGMNVSKTNNSITISEGLCEIGGRPVAVIDSETVSLGTNTAYCILVLEIDLSKTTTKDTFEQVAFKVLESSTGYPSVTQQDINVYNGSNTIYQLEFARFRNNASGISDFKDTRKMLDFQGIYNQIKAECQEIINQIKQELNNVEDGSAYVLKNTNISLDGAVKGSASFNQGSNVKITTALNNVFVLTGEKSISSSETKVFPVTLAYPTGLNMNNCIPIAFSLKSPVDNIGENYYGFYNDSSDSYAVAFYRRLNLTSEGIKLSIKNPYPSGDQREINFKYKVVLLKIS